MQEDFPQSCMCRARTRQPVLQKRAWQFGHAYAVASPQPPQTPGSVTRTGAAAWWGGALRGLLVRLRFMPPGTVTDRALRWMKTAGSEAQRCGRLVISPQLLPRRLRQRPQFVAGAAEGHGDARVEHVAQLAEDDALLVTAQRRERHGIAGGAPAAKNERLEFFIYIRVVRYSLGYL